MATYSYSSTSTSTSTSSYSPAVSECSRASSVTSELDELLYKGLGMTVKEKERLGREFCLPKRISMTGNYYPRYKVCGDSQTGTSHVSYLSRPYYSYLVNSRYAGYSKYVYITKLN